MSSHDPDSVNPSPSPEGQETVSISKKEYEGLLAKLKELEGAQERFLRGAADFENAKKRLAREREEFIKFSQENLLRELLPILDNFERALSHAGESKKDPVIAGIQMVFKQLGEIFKSQGLVRIKTVGELFDPSRHEAVAFVSSEGREDEIVEEIESGYFLHDRLLRAAKVRVRSSEKTEEIT